MPEPASDERGLPIGLVLLAAGASSRFGSPKQLVLVNGIPLLQLLIDVARSTQCHPLILVLGANHEEIQKQIDTTDLLVEIAPDWSDGLSASIRAGVRRLRHEAPKVHGVMLMLGDQPGVKTASLLRLLAAFSNRPSDIVASQYSGQSGVPVVFGSEYLDALDTLSGDGGAKQLIKLHPELVISVAMPEAAWDIDTLNDLPRDRLQ